MNIDEFKNHWNELNNKLESLQTISVRKEELALQNKASSRIETLKSENQKLCLLFGIEAFIILAILTGNPFDFIHAWQFIPFGILGIAIIIALLRSIRTLRSLDHLNSDQNLSSYLKTAIVHFEKVELFNRWFRLSFLAAGICTIFSFIPHLTASREFTSVAPFILFLVAFSWSIYWLIFKSGWIVTNRSAAFENDLKEWEDLRALSA
ncbi:hypothetical protein [Jiulongibacter sediminis]|jgi:hypothetical protein|uniref:hypothetical protein n=1 Tax=Jiulongibacter sediminis TaxID=1605367 RepID=UPI0026EE4CE5|nr:hypothetical protein [Jiulongibacter sediminis]